MLEWQGNDDERTLHLLYGALPEWFPLPILEQARLNVSDLRGDKFTPEQIAQFATDAMADKFTAPGKFFRAVDELVHIKYALSLSENKCLEMLAGKLSVSGAKSHQGYKSRDEFQDKPDCQAIAKMMWKNNPSMTIAGLIKTPEIATYAKKYPGKNTLRDWLSEIDPRSPELKRGRRKPKN